MLLDHEATLEVRQNALLLASTGVEVAQEQLSLCICDDQGQRTWQPADMDRLQERGPLSLVTPGARCCKDSPRLLTTGSFCSAARG